MGRNSRNRRRSPASVSALGYLSYLARRLLRGHVARGSQNRAARRSQRFAVELFCQAEVRHFRLPIDSEQYVQWFQVTVNHASLVGEVHRARQHFHQFRGRTIRQRCAAKFSIQAAALRLLHREVRPTIMFADLEHLDDVVMSEMTYRLHLAAKAG